MGNIDSAMARERAERLGRRLNAVVTVFDQAVIGQVVAEERLSETSSTLRGLPVAVKDIIDIAGHPRGNGNPYDMASAPAEADAPVVALLRAAGADVFAATSLLEYAAGATHPDIPEARNPYDPSRTAGGSSGGSAALVGVGVCQVALGTDTGGSIRIPAHYCATVGFKPSYGVLSLDGVEPLSPTLDHVGLLADTVAMTRRVFLAMTRGVTGPTDGSVESAVIGTTDTPPVGALRIGVIVGQLDAVQLEQEVASAVQQAIDTLRRAGCSIVEVDGSVLTELNLLLGDILLFEAWQSHRGRVTTAPDHYGPETLRLLLSASKVTREEYEKAMFRRQELLAPAARVYDGVDVLLTPAAPFVAPESTPPVDTPEGEAEGMFTGIFNMTGDPAIVLPCGFSRKGLPIGVQLSFARGRDHELLAAAAYVESVLAVPSHTPAAAY
jgi:Asp-tRNA(Asn)/Glu-tRNA(Gln) amidotransferase A subunit family amidase